MLSKLYKDVNKNKKEIEIVFCSFDKSKPDFENYFKEMPWLAVSFDDQDTIKKLAKQYNVNGIPCLLIVNSNGEVLNDDGYMDLAQASDQEAVIKSWKELY
eukprot:CAMPEP_0176436614 /NCGR_PEP_ID=MMETSP0127-20121128/18080_1 /TAXON_ID=938130 /ORGANISM="Platyophrya macrostoma, Strain WH" /LENGTH=100 /DNA_ID=CAMNT_0017819981 /DNA_START=322 /DNA_END=624 /DNA_ORIENTATION=-